MRQRISRVGGVLLLSTVLAACGASSRTVATTQEVTPPLPVVVTLRSTTTRVPSGQRVRLVAEAVHPPGTTLVVRSVKGAFQAQTTEDRLDVTTTAIVDRSTTQIYVAQIQRQGHSLASSDPVTITYTLQPNGTDHGYVGHTGQVVGQLTGLRAATQSQTPQLTLSGQGSIPLRYQYWYTTSQGWGHTGFVPTPHETLPVMTQGIWAVTGYANRSGFPDTKPFLSKAMTYWVAANQPLPLGFAVSRDVVHQGQSVTLTAPAGYVGYQWWWAPQAGHDGHWESNGPYQASARTETLTPNMPGAWEVAVYGQTAQGTTHPLGTLYINVNQ